MIDYANLTPEAMANMTDEEFGKLDPSQIPNTVIEQPSEEVQSEPTQEVETVVEQPTPSVEEVASESTANGEPSEAEVTQAADTVAQPTDETQQPNTQQEQPNEEAATVDTTPEKAFFDKVTAEFTANGKQYKIDNPEDAVKLMQMGLNYNQKMAAMKPNLKIVKALQEAGITSIDQLGHLLDIHARKPEAIAKLVQDSGLDTYEFEEQAKGYVPSAPQINDQVIEFEMVAQELESNPSFATVVNHLATFDQQTREHIFAHPDIMRTLTDHVTHGYFDKIKAQYDIQSALGKTRGLTFLQAYENIGQAMFGQQQAPAQQQVPVPAAQPVPVPVATKPNPVNNTARQAAATNTSTATQTHKPAMTPQDLWDLSDEEFAKLDPKFLK